MRRPPRRLAATLALAAAAGLAASGVAPAAGASASSAVYDQTCAMCHQLGGTGVPGAFPRLAGRAGALAALPAGRGVMISAVLYGVSGRLPVDGQTIVGFMPSFGQLTDAQIAEALDYVAHLDGKTPRPFTAAEIAAARAAPALTPAQVNALARDPSLLAAAP